MPIPRLTVVIGVAAAVGGLVMPSVTTDEAMVAEFTVRSVPWIWGSLGQTSQWILVVGVVVASVLAIGTQRSRVAALVIAGAAVGGIVVMWMNHIDAARAADLLAAEFERASAQGWIESSPGASTGVGYLLALGGWVLALSGGLWGGFGSDRDAGDRAGATTDGDDRTGGVRSSEVPDRTDSSPTAETSQRYIDVIIENGGPSTGE